MMVVEKCAMRANPDVESLPSLSLWHIENIGNGGVKVNRNTGKRVAYNIGNHRRKSCR